MSDERPRYVDAPDQKKLSRRQQLMRGRTVPLADCIAATRGQGFASIPKYVISSPAYRDFSAHARAVLVELTACMNVYNNGSIAASRRALVEALRCSPNTAVAALTKLVEHGMIDVRVEGQWKARLARKYRLTFVSTKTAYATEDYRLWTPARSNPALSRS